MTSTKHKNVVQYRTVRTFILPSNKQILVSHKSCFYFSSRLYDKNFRYDHFQHAFVRYGTQLYDS